MCANHHSEKRIIWIVIVAAGIAGFILEPSRRRSTTHEAVAEVTSVSR